MKLILQRRILMNGALTGTLSVEHRNEFGRLSGIEKICDTMERKNGQLPTGEYRVVIGKCSRFARQMNFLEPIREDSSSSSSLPLPETCKLCRMAHAPGFVLKSQERFLQLFDRVSKMLRRGGEVVIKIE